MNSLDPTLRWNLPRALAAAIALALCGYQSVRGGGHGDAPLTQQDPPANITDVYAFIGARFDDPSRFVLNVLVCVWPFSDPGNGGVYHRFADDARYSIHIANPVTGETITRYDFTFSSVSPGEGDGLKNPDTILSYGFDSEPGAILAAGDGRQNYTQTFSVRKNGRRVAKDLLVPPPNVGLRTTPRYNDPTTGKAISGADTLSTLDKYTRETIHSLASGEVVWAGSREDGFYGDLPGIFDLLDPRIVDNNGTLSDGFGQDGNGIDGFKGFNVLAYCIQIPVDDLKTIAFDDFFGPAIGVGVFASVSRHTLTTRSSRRGPSSTGPWVSVSRMGNPLFSQFFLPLKAKDIYNRLAPATDARKFAAFANHPEIATLLKSVFGIPISDNDRFDLEALFIPDVIRVDTTTPPVSLAGEARFSRFSHLGGDFTVRNLGLGDPVSAGWPNGRRPGDDVVDLVFSLTAGFLFGDNVLANDQSYNRVFPYLATPHAGPTTQQRQRP